MKDKMIRQTIQIGRNEELMITYNPETRLIVVDVTKGDFGNEFVRREVPKIDVAKYRRMFERYEREMAEREQDE